MMILIYNVHMIIQRGNTHMIGLYSVSVQHIHSESLGQSGTIAEDTCLGFHTVRSNLKPCGQETNLLIMRPCLHLHNLP